MQLSCKDTLRASGGQVVYDKRDPEGTEGTKGLSGRESVRRTTTYVALTPRGSNVLSMS